MKYKLGEKHPTENLYRVVAIKDFGDVREGDIGGWVEGEHNLSHDGGCWVYGSAWVFGDARVSDSAQVFGDARVYGSARVYEDAEVSGDARVYEDARVFAPPKKEWVGLTAKDLAEIPPSCFEGAIWADAKLQEKNT